MAIQTAELKPTVASSPLAGFWKVFSRNRIAVFGVIMLLSVVLVAVFAPAIAPFDPRSSAGIGTGDVYNPPGPLHWLGTNRHYQE